MKGQATAKGYRRQTMKRGVKRAAEASPRNDINKITRNLAVAFDQTMELRRQHKDNKAFSDDLIRLRERIAKAIRFADGIRSYQ